MIGTSRRGCQVRKVRRAASAVLESLETRRLFHHIDPNHPDDHDDDNDPITMSVIAMKVANSPHVGPFASVGAAGTIPALNSDDDATAQLFLDFAGAASMSWAGKTTGITPAYDTDGDAATFTGGELANITEIWKRVSEIYSPFNINVTTVNPGNLTDKVTTEVVIGGTGSWYGSAGGVAYVGGFSNGASNIAWVFPKMLANGNTKYTAEAISHEAGHTFGLQHQSTYSGSSKTNEYNPGNAAKAPIMGGSYAAARALWWNGTSSISSSTIQNDVTVVSGSDNGFGYRADDHGNTTGTATAVDIDDDQISGSGVIEQLTDKDYFSFTTLAGDITLSVAPAQYGGMLDATLTLLDSGGSVVATADTASLGETISTSVSSGTYYLVVGSKGNAGDIGQFTVSGTIITSPDYVARPTALTATAVDGDVELDWTDKSGNETGFAIERSSNNGTSWSQIDTAAANAVSYTDTGSVVGTAYKYRVKATGSAQDSGYSATASVNVLPETPADFAAESVSSSAIGLSWTDVDGESGYRIDRSLNGTTWTQLAVPSADAESYSDTGLSATTKYYYRLVAVSGIGNSAATATVNATTTPAAPGTLTAAVTINTITLTWTNVAGETGYRIEKSDDNSTWTQLATVGANIATYKHTGLSPNAKVYYRVKSIGAGGDSVATSTASATTLMSAPTDLYAFAATGSSMKVSWADLNGETGYRLEKLTGTTSWSQVGSDLAANKSVVTVTGLSPGLTYSFRVSALNAGGNSAASAVLKGTTVPPVPATVTATALSASEIKVAWANVATEAGYRIDRSTDGSTWKWVGNVAAETTTFTDTVLAAGTQYYYRVRAYSDAGNGTYSATVNTTTLASGTAASGSANASASVALAWSASSGASKYRVERSVDGKHWIVVKTVGKNILSYEDDKLDAGKYFYRVRTFKGRASTLGGPVATKIA